MLSEDKKKRIEALSTEEMAYEVNKGNASRFQRDAYAYLKACYESKIRGESTAADVSTNVDRTVNSGSSHVWHESALGKIAIGLIIMLLGAVAIWSLNHYLKLGL